jgi:UDPglucose 6-dehydrogenase
MEVASGNNQRSQQIVTADLAIDRRVTRMKTINNLHRSGVVMFHSERFELFRAGFATKVAENGVPRFAGWSWSSHKFVWADSADSFNQHFGADSPAVAWNPEFLREGSAVADSLSPDRIVAGVTSSRAEGLLLQVYARPIADGSLFITTGLETAELAKAAANAFLATKISFINAMAEVCEAAGGDVQVLSRILGADSRIGPAFLRPGLGFGGGCLPKDIRAFIARAADLDAGQALGFLHEVDAINLRRRIRTADLACEMAGGDLTDVPVCVLGAAFKPGSDDVRDSPALDVAQILHGMGAQVTVYDPAALDNARRACPELGYAETLAEAAQGAHIVLLLTEWAEFTGLRPADLETVVAQRNIVDGRSILDPDLWHAAGWNYRALGVAMPPPLSTHPL